MLARLRADEDPTIAAVGRALTRATSPPRRDEQVWIERIEALRTELGRSGAVVHTARSQWTGDAADDDRVRQTQVARLALEASKPARWGRVLLNLSRELRAERMLELGTCVGLSTAYQAAGLELRGGAGAVLTLEAAPERVELAGANLERLGLAGRVDARAGRFEETLDPALADAGRVGFAFIDGHHKRKPTLDYFERVSASIEGAGVILFDDIRWSRGMSRAWERISVDPRVSLAADLHGLGLCVVHGGEAHPDGVPHKLEVVLHP